MTLFDQILYFHIAAGGAALVFGPIAMFSRKRRGLHTNAGRIYHGLVLCVCLSSGLLAVLKWALLWWFLPIGLGSYALAFVGYRSAKHPRRENWLRWHITGFGGSYIAMTTALLVVNWRYLADESGLESPMAWILPTLIGSPIIAWVNHRHRSRRS